LRGLKGDTVAHSNQFELLVSGSINAVEAFPSVEPSELAQMEARVTQAKADAVAAADRAEAAAVHPPKLSGDQTWMVWDLESGAYQDTGVYSGGAAPTLGPTGIGSSAAWIPAYRRRVPEENRDLSVPLVPRERREIQENRDQRGPRETPGSKARRGRRAIPAPRDCKAQKETRGNRASKARRGPKVTPETPARRVPQVRMASASPP
ncbi:hypothetical protein, partial [Intestinimonas sp. RTP31139st1_F5_RTP31139_211217]|uniref:hypothetical protein n=1 Tax=Intestinimonas sp. RTP31139st1_F5_RTP31139_211217 TaxID=3143190 RepID=UPI0032EE5C87